MASPPSSHRKLFMHLLYQETLRLRRNQEKKTGELWAKRTQGISEPRCLVPDIYVCKFLYQMFFLGCPRHETFLLSMMCPPSSPRDCCFLGRNMRSQFPVLPMPPFLTASGSSPQDRYFWKMPCAMRSPRWMTCGSLPRLRRQMMISPSFFALP